jgi:geranylgeranyl diphosphate synthase type II
VLCGDALLSLGFEILAARLPETGLDAPTALRCTETLTQAAGSRWLAGGQAMDITEQTTNYTDRSPETVLRIHERKTVALMQACCAIGGLIGRADDGQIRRLREYGYWLGLAFQITDDILDQTGDGKSLGKTVGKDAQQKKLTYPMVFGLERSRRLASEAAQSAVRALDSFDGIADWLCALALSLPERQS